MVLKGVNWVHNDAIGSNGLEMSHLDIQCIKWCQMVLKGVIGYKYKNQVKWSWNESFGYTVIKWCQMVLKGVNWVHNDKTGSNGLEGSQLGTQL